MKATNENVNAIYWLLRKDYRVFDVNVSRLHGTRSETQPCLREFPEKNVFCPSNGQLIESTNTPIDVNSHKGDYRLVKGLTFNGV